MCLLTALKQQFIQKHELSLGPCFRLIEHVISLTFAFRGISVFGESNYYYLAKDNKDLFLFKARSPAELIY
jgi:hypothetical protein